MNGPKSFRRRRWQWQLFSIPPLLLATQLLAENWPQWRGPNFDGASVATNLPARWTLADHTLWTTPLPGRSGATPIIWDDAIFLPSPDTNKNLLLFCIDKRTGAVRWQKQIASGDRAAGKNNMASSSAVTDGKLVIALFGTSDLAALDFAGNTRWQRKLSEEFGGFANMFLYGASPLLFQGRLYVPLLQRNPPTYGHAQDDKPERQSYLICIDPGTGKTLWKHERPTDAVQEAMEAYTTPIPFHAADGEQILLLGANFLTAHRPDNGEELWRYGGINAKRRADGRIVPSPVVTPGRIFICGPKREKLVALKTGAHGLVEEAQVAWTFDQFSPDVCTPLFYRGRLFVLDGDRQMLTCFKPDSGEQIWQGNLGVREVFSASPTGADGRIYCISESGTLVVLSAGDSFQVLDTIALGESPCRSTIVANDARLFIRTAENLRCIGARK